MTMHTDINNAKTNTSANNKGTLWNKIPYIPLKPYTSKKQSVLYSSYHCVMSISYNPE